MAWWTAEVRGFAGKNEGCQHKTSIFRVFGVQNQSTSQRKEAGSHITHKW